LKKKGGDRLLILAALQGYENDHRDIELLRLKNYTIGKKLADKDVLAPQALNTICNLLATLVPFVSLSVMISQFPVFNSPHPEIEDIEYCSAKTFDVLSLQEWA
jgi:hypothetical protein